jgi:hypothetical protein
MILHLGPPSSTSLSLSSVFSARALPPLCQPCAPPLPTQHRSVPSTCPSPLHRRLPRPRAGHSLPSPRRPPSARTAPHRRSPSQRLPRHLLPSDDSTRHFPTVPPPSRRCAVSPRVLHDALPLPSFAVPPRAPPAHQLLLGHGHSFFWTPSSSSSFSSARPGICTSLFHSIFPALATTSHRTSPATPAVTVRVLAILDIFC